mmetsp:Transcript_112658/g.349661  ORF Transcript_112658/g.349661 Transcript_112658/m.349661 type:complete len:406 (-) Transcript_112658:117-1334(-)
MVVAQVVRVRNNTLRTFHLQAGDPFYTPRIDDQPCVEGYIKVPPGFDQAADGLVVPWEATTYCGLEITEDDSEQLLRCVVGPKEEPEGDGRDWLQFRSAAWEPLARDRWSNLGRRHLLGAVGGAVEIQLTFRDARGQSTDSPAELVEVTHFEYATRCAAQNTVFLNVFDLASALSIPNAMLCNTVFNTIGAFHAAVEVYGEEWSFYRTPNPTSCGVCKSLRPRHHPVHVYRQSVNLGVTSLKDWEVRYLIRGKLAAKWPGGQYDLLNRNCIHFCEELLLSLGVKPVPAWVRGLHETGASVLRVPWPLSALFGGGGGPPSKPKALTDGSHGGGDGDQSVDDNFCHAETASAAPSDTTCTSTAGRTSVGPLDPGRAPVDGTFIDADGEDIDLLTRKTALAPRFRGRG